MRFHHRIKSVQVRLFLYFFTLAIIGTALLSLPLCYKNGMTVPLIDSLFTTVSAICVTGLSTVDMRLYTGAGLAVILLLIEAGGLGLVSFFTVFLVFSAKKISLLNRNIIRDYFTEDSAVESRQIIKVILITTLAFQATGALVLAPLLKTAGESHWIFYAIFLSISAFCNAGFSPYADSLAQFSGNGATCLWLSVLIIAGGLGFIVIANVIGVAKSRFSKKSRCILSLHSKIVLLMTFVLIAAGTLVFFFAEKDGAFSGMSFFKALNCAFFQSVTLRTAGFETVSQADFSPLSTFSSIILMLTGGSPGSMAGGLKTTTLFLLVCVAYKRASDKNAPSVFRRDIAEESTEKALAVFVKGVCLLCVMYALLLISESASLKVGTFSAGELFFEAASAFGTVGLSKGITAALSSAGKILVMLLMFAGRTGITFIALGSLYKEKPIDSLADFPKESVLIG